MSKEQAKKLTKKIKKLKPLTLAQQKEILDNLVLLQMVILGHEHYLLTIDKLDEGRMFVSEYINKAATKPQSENKERGVEDGEEEPIC